MMKSLAQRLEETNQRPSGFDYMRLVLSTMVMVFHTIVICSGFEAQDAFLHTAYRPVFSMVVPMFFAVSGFLVAGSLDHCKSLVSFLGLRVLRIIPGLAGLTFFTALVVGPVFTTWPLSQYFAEYEFRSYLLTAVGDIHRYLPGVFEHNPFPRSLNGQLWTLPFEMDSYMIMAGVAGLTVFRRRQVFLALVVAWYGFQLLKMGMDMRSGATEMRVGVQGKTLISIFLVGALVYRYREKVPFHFGLFVAALAATIVLAYLPPHGYRFLPLPVVYVTVYLGLLNPKRNAIVRSGDYSYGIFLYGFMVQQTMAALGPWAWHWYWNLLFSVPVTALLAWASWRFIEKPALRQRKRLEAMDARHGALFKRLRLHNP
ncbi:MAG: acyltransferase [Rickettsiales bacterium]|nr:acyltransferase [Rickettsiales bacterium]